MQSGEVKNLTTNLATLTHGIGRPSASPQTLDGKCAFVRVVRFVAKSLSAFGMQISTQVCSSDRCGRETGLGGIAGVTVSHVTNQAEPRV